MSPQPDLSHEVAAWIANAMPTGTDTPCGHYTAATRTTCMATPTRQYMGGRRCFEHAPVAITRNPKENA